VSRFADAWKALVNPNRPVSSTDLSDRAAQIAVNPELDRMEPGERAALSRPAGTFGAASAFPAGVPMMPRPVNPPDPSGITSPRRWQYPVGFNLPLSPGASKLVDFRALRALADVESILRRCIEARKQEIAQLDWAIVPRNPADKDQFSDAIANLTRFFLTPDRVNGINMDDWLKMALEEVFVVDALSIYRRPSFAGKLHSLQIVDGTTIKPLIDDWGNRPQPPAPAYQQFVYGLPSMEFSAGEETPSYDAKVQAKQRGQVANSLDARGLTSAELLYRPHTRRSWTVYGFPNVEQIILYINLMLKRLQWHTAAFTDGNIPEMFGKVPPDWSPQQVAEWQELWDQLFAGDVAHQRRIHWVPSGAEFADVRDPSKVHLIDFDEFLLKIICAGMDVQPQEIGFAQDVNRAQGEMQENVTYRRSLRPLISWWQVIFNEIIAQDFGLPELQFKFMGIEWEDQQKQADINTKYISIGARTIDQFRVNVLGEEPLADGLGSEPIIISGRTVVKLRDVIEGTVATPDLTQSPPPTAETVIQTAAPDLSKAIESVDCSVVHDYLAETYPEDTIGWVEDATWSYSPAVGLDVIDMDRRPGGRDSSKVDAIEQAVRDGEDLPPVVLVDDGTGDYEIADGYHRTLGVKHAEETSIPAYIGVVEELPDLEAMHEAKLNKALGAYQRFVLARLRKGRSLRPFEVPGDAQTTVNRIHNELRGLEVSNSLTPDAVKAVFANARTDAPVGA
jgi:Phage portal protein